MYILGQLYIIIGALQQVGSKLLSSTTSSVDWVLIFTILGVVVAIIVGIAAIVVPRYFNQKRISCKVMYVKALVTISQEVIEEVAEEIQVTFNKIYITDNLHAVGLKLWNSGKTSITRNKVDEPITIHFGKGSEVLRVAVISPKMIPSSFNIGEVFLRPLLLKKDEAITIEVILTKFNINSNLNVVVPIADVNVKKIHDLKPVNSFSWMKIVAICASLLAIVLNIGLLIYSIRLFNKFLPSAELIFVSPQPPTINDYKFQINNYIDEIAQIRQSLSQVISIYEWFIFIDILVIIIVLVIVVRARFFS